MLSTYVDYESVTIYSRIMETSCSTIESIQIHLMDIMGFESSRAKLRVRVANMTRSDMQNIISHDENTRNRYKIEAESTSIS